MLPCVVSWPRDAPDAVYEAVQHRYFAPAFVSRFQYCILMHRAESAAEALDALSRAGAFATHAGRTALLGVIDEARNTPWCKQEVLDTLHRYATFAFVLDGTAVTCGLPG